MKIAVAKDSVEQKVLAFSKNLPQRQIFRGCTVEKTQRSGPGRNPVSLKPWFLTMHLGVSTFPATLKDALF